MRRPLLQSTWCRAALCTLALSLAACGADDRVVVPNRVLDRPLDAVLACVRDTGTQMEVLSLNQCDGAINGRRCDIADSPTPQLIGFVANSERNELAMFRRCDFDAGLVDMDSEAPGYQFLPAGRLPSRLTITDDSCRVVSANAGSCDMTLLDVAGLAEYAVNTTLTSDGDESTPPPPPDLPPPSTLSSTLIPRRGNGIELGSSPGDILAVPSALSLAGDGTEVPTGETDDGTVDDGGLDGGLGPDSTGLACDTSRPASVYVTFPACQLVAEISLGTQTILQSRRFVTTEDGTVEVIDSGTEPLCPVDCPAQFEGELPDEIELVDPDGVFPTTLALVTPPSEDELTLDPVKAALTYSTLFVGGPGSDSVFEIAIGEDGRFAETALAVPLENAQGVQRIRVTPAFIYPQSAVGGGGTPTNPNAATQFLYVIAGDGSTHVVERDLDEGMLGLECDTQVDPTLESNVQCVPLVPGQVDSSVNRRPFAVGPGIRASGGATVNDWAFHELISATDAEDNPNDGDQDPSLQTSRTPFGALGVVAVGVTSLGTVVYASLGQFSADDSVSATVDPVHVMDVQVRPHSLWPAIDPFADQPVADALPLVADEEPGRAIPGGGDESETLSPSLRRIDLTYAGGDDLTAEQNAIAADLGNPLNADALGSNTGEALYENAAPRVAVRDSQGWGSQTWTLEWESTLPGTTSGTGLLQCDSHGGTDADGNEVPGGTCRNVEANDARLLDEGADFCEDGVLAGDKLVVLGCSDDDSCGLGQRCLRDPTATSNATGICVSELAFETEREALRDACAPFINDPCGLPTREYRITRATNGELWLAGLELPLRAVVRDLGVISEDDPLDAAPDVDLREYEARLSCEAPVRRVEEQSCRSDEDCRPDPYDLVGEDPNQRGALTCELLGDDPDSGRCVGRQPDGGCNDDDDCRGLGRQYMCVESLCRAPCELCAPPTGEQPPRPCDSQFTIDGEFDGEGNPQVFIQQCMGDDQVCMAGVCHVPCTDGNPGCLRSPLPGPRCFPELIRYTVRLHESFAFSGSGTPFLTDRVQPDPDTGECIEDDQVSNLLTSRIRLGPDAASTFGTGVWQIPDCTNPEQASPDDPNPCRIVAERAADGLSRFHTFRYLEEPIPAIRYSNPVMSVVIDLTSLTGIVSTPPSDSDGSWPVSFATFLRSRIPTGYREEFSSTNGYIPFNEPVVVRNTPMVYPVTIINAPELRSDFIVDAGGRGGVAGVRGQVVRIDHGTGQVFTDQNFRVR